jgi:hypothetical protein
MTNGVRRQSGELAAIVVDHHDHIGFEVLRFSANVSALNCEAFCGSMTSIVSCPSCSNASSQSASNIGGMS